MNVTLHILDWAAIVFYLVAVLVCGSWAGRFTRTSHEFFFGGQRYAWWLVAVSCVATLVGAYSFQQYSELGYKFGFCSMMPYTNEWFVQPAFLLGWLPIVYYSRVQSIPEYFERRFDRRTRLAVLVVLMVYLLVYIGINLLTIGLLLHGMFPFSGPSVALADTVGLLTADNWGVMLWAAAMALFCVGYLFLGGQNSVMLTDLLQGAWLLAVGLAVFGLGVWRLGGWETFWAGLPLNHRLPLAQFREPPGLHAAGDFWNDAIVGTFGFYLINQGILMRFLSARSVRDGRRAMLATIVVLMPIAAIAVSGAGWVGRSLETHGQLHEAAQAASIDSATISEANLATNIFIVVARIVCTLPGMFGVVIAAILAALMSTLTTYITAVAAVAVNDIWRTVQPGRGDTFYLSAARFTAVLATLLGVAMVPIFNRFDSIYQAISYFTSAISPPLVVVIFLAITWRKFTPRGAFWTLVLGSAAMLASMHKPALISFLGHGEGPETGYPYLRALFGLVVSAPLALGITWFDHSSRTRRPGDRTLFWFALLAGMSLLYVWAPTTAADGAALRPPVSSTVLLSAAALAASAAAALAIAVFDAKKPGPLEAGLDVSTLPQARAQFKRGRPNDRHIGRRAVLSLAVASDLATEADGFLLARLPSAVMQQLDAEVGDLIYVSDARWWLGGFRSLHVRAGAPLEDDARLWVSPSVIDQGHLLAHRYVMVEKTM